MYYVRFPAILLMASLGLVGCDRSPYNSDDWQLQRHAELNEIARRGDIDLVFLGDSITQKWEDVGSEVWGRYYAQRKAANFGIKGDRTEHVVWRIDHGNLDGIHPKTIVVLIGTNDAYVGRTPQEIANGVIAVVQKLRAKVPDSKILVLGIFPSGERPDNAQRLRTRAANMILSKVVNGTNVRFLDIGDRFVNRDGTISKHMMPDFWHLGPEAYALWAEALEPVLNDHRSSSRLPRANMLG
ncbi:MAG TPA: GDSL-type esterase/lipase family protein [Nitrospira sp.]|nr:GDSL-type esterase/lipase family protein [Nitrospira sp.]